MNYRRKGLTDRYVNFIHIKYRTLTCFDFETSTIDFFLITVSFNLKTVYIRFGYRNQNGYSPIRFSSTLASLASNCSGNARSTVERKRRTDETRKMQHRSQTRWSRGKPTKSCRMTIRKTITVLTAAELAATHKRNVTHVDEDVAILPGYNVTTTSSGTASKTSNFETDLHGNVNIFLGGWVAIARLIVSTRSLDF